MENLEYAVERKPDPRVCPRRFCFFWQMGEPLPVSTPDPSSVAKGCRCSFGVCRRLDSERGDRDWYEPHEPNLRDAGLPWFYFIPSPNSLRPELQQRYITESERLWGPEHGAT